MTHADRIKRLRAKLQAFGTCGVPFTEGGTPTEPGMRACLQCWHTMTVKRAKSYGTSSCVGCHRTVRKMPIVRDVKPRGPRAVDPLREVKRERDTSAKALSNWERRLSLSLTKMKQARARYKRACAKYEIAVAGLTPPKPAAGRRIIVADDEGVQA